MSDTIKLPYSKKYTGGIIQPITEAIVGMSLCRSVKELSSDKNKIQTQKLDSVVINGILGNLISLAVNLIQDYKFDDRNCSAVKVSTSNGNFVIESSIAPGLITLLPFGISLLGIPLSILFEEELEDNPEAINYIDGWYQYGFPISTAILRAIDKYPEKLYEHSCKDADKLIRHHSHFHHNGICRDNTTYSRAPDKSKTLLHISDDVFQVLHNGEAVEVLQVIATNFWV